MSTLRAVVLSEGAQLDLNELHRYVTKADGLQRADRLIDSIATALKRLPSFPERGEFPGELLDVGIKQYRQAHVKPYRIVYEVKPAEIVVHLIVDGRRNMQDLLMQRLLR